MAVKERLDLLLVLQNLSVSRQQAQKLILAGEVKVNGQMIDKPGTFVDTKAHLEVFQHPPYVSRGGEKLAKALKLFQINVENRLCLDGGISTGGFTDCLLQAGAQRVYGVDVGYGQVAWTLRQDARVFLKERTNIRYLSYSELYGEEPPANLGVVDLSFISLTKILPTLWNLLVPPKEVILLVKPQFEVGRDKVGKNGVVRNPQDQALAVDQVWQVGNQVGWSYCGLSFSPITGPAGNIEYLLMLSTQSNLKSPTIAQIQEITEEAFSQLASKN